MKKYSKLILIVFVNCAFLFFTANAWCGGDEDAAGRFIKAQEAVNHDISNKIANASVYVEYILAAGVVGDFAAARRAFLYATRTLHLQVKSIYVVYVFVAAKLGYDKEAHDALRYGLFVVVARDFHNAVENHELNVRLCIEYLVLAARVEHGIDAQRVLLEAKKNQLINADIYVAYMRFMVRIGNPDEARRAYGEALIGGHFNDNIRNAHMRLMERYGFVRGFGGVEEGAAAGGAAEEGAEEEENDNDMALHADDMDAAAAANPPPPPPPPLPGSGRELRYLRFGDLSRFGGFNGLGGGSM